MSHEYQALLPLLSRTFAIGPQGVNTGMGV